MSRLARGLGSAGYKIVSCSGLTRLLVCQGVKKGESRNSQTQVSFAGQQRLQELTSVSPRDISEPSGCRRTLTINSQLAVNGGSSVDARLGWPRPRSVPEGLRGESRDILHEGCS